MKKVWTPLLLTVAVLGSGATPALAAVDEPKASAQDAAMAAAAREVPLPGRRTQPNPGLSAKAAKAGAEAVGDVVVSGVLRGTKGNALPGVALRIDLEPTAEVTGAAAEGEGVELVRLGDTVTGSGGRFVLRSTDLGDDLAGYASDDGSVGVMLTSQSAKASLMYHLRLLPPTDGSSAWTWADADDVVAAARAGRGKPVELDMKVHSESAESSGEVGTLGLSGSDYCAGSFYWQRSDANVIRTWDPIQRIYTMGRTRVSYAWNNSSLTQVDASANTGSGGALVAAGLTRVQSTSSGTTLSSSTNANVDYQYEIDSRPYYLYCNDPGGARYSGRYEWRPYVWTGGSRAAAPRYTIFTCNSAYRSQISGPSWSARSASYTYSAGVTIGATLRVQQTNSSSHVLTFTPTSGSAFLCGSNGYWNGSTTRQVREVA